MFTEYDEGDTLAKLKKAIKIYLSNYHVIHHFNEPAVMGAEWYVVECNDEITKWLVEEHNAATYHDRPQFDSSKHPPGYKQRKRIIITPDAYHMLVLRYG
jgi:hypothetical protein